MYSKRDIIKCLQETTWSIGTKPNLTSHSLLYKLDCKTLFQDCSHILFHHTLPKVHIPLFSSSSFLLLLHTHTHIYRYIYTFIFYSIVLKLYMAILETGIVLCLLVVLNNANSSSAARLLLNRTTDLFMSREQQQHRRNLLDNNGLGLTPPMG